MLIKVSNLHCSYINASWNHEAKIHIEHIAELFIYAMQIEPAPGAFETWLLGSVL